MTTKGPDPASEGRPPPASGGLVAGLRLRAPDSISWRRYDASCRAVLVLATALGLQTIAILMMALGPLAPPTHDPETLTAAGRYFLRAEYDKEAYALGCLVTVALACAGLLAWNRLLHRMVPTRRAAFARRAAPLFLSVAALGTAAFALVLRSVAARPMASHRLLTGDLLTLAALPVLALMVTGIALGLAWRAERGPST